MKYSSSPYTGPDPKQVYPTVSGYDVAPELAQIFVSLLRTIAHELNNPLTGIAGYAHMLQELFPPEAPEYEDLEEIKLSSQQCKRWSRLLSRIGGSADERPFFQPVTFLDDLSLILESYLPREKISLTYDHWEDTAFPPHVQGSYQKSIGAMLFCAQTIAEISTSGSYITLSTDKMDDLTLRVSIKCDPHLPLPSPPTWLAEALTECRIKLQRITSGPTPDLYGGYTLILENYSPPSEDSNSGTSSR